MPRTRCKDTWPPRQIRSSFEATHRTVNAHDTMNIRYGSKCFRCNNLPRFRPIQSPSFHERRWLSLMIDTEHELHTSDSKDTWPSPTIRFVMGRVHVRSFHVVMFTPAPPARETNVVVRHTLQRAVVKLNCGLICFFPTCSIAASAWCFHQRSPARSVHRLTLGS